MTAVLNESTVSKFALSKVFDNNTSRINALDFDSRGEFIVTSSDDESLHLYHVDTAHLKKTVQSKRYGVSNVRFTHNSNSVIAASRNAWDDSIRYLSLHDNKYLRYYKGHRSNVVSLEMSPVDDSFLSGSIDNTVRLWDLRTNACQGLIRIEGRPAVAYDAQGMVFAVASGKGAIKLYDVRSFDKGPFLPFTVADEGKSNEWMSMKFSPDGKYILLSTDENRVLLLDAFDGKLIQTYTSHVNQNHSSLEASFSPDAQFVLSGSEDGTVHIWETLSGKQVTVLKGHPGAVRCVQFNPCKMLIVSACTKLGMWLPSLSELKSDATSSSSSSSSASATAGSSGVQPMDTSSDDRYSSSAAGGSASSTSGHSIGHAPGALSIPPAGSSGSSSGNVGASPSAGGGRHIVWGSARS